MGTESWLSESVLDSEVFPGGFSVYRKDRHAHGGGVFLLIDAGWASSQLLVPYNNTESIWCRVQLSKGGTIVLGTYYRPPNMNDIDELSHILSSIPDSSVIIGGDFNLPNVEWTGTSFCTDNSSLYKGFNDLIISFSLQQFVLSPTRNNSILDLLLTNNPSLVSNVTVIPGISDHSAVVCDLSLNQMYKTSMPPRKIIMYERGDYESISHELSVYFPNFLNLSVESNVDHLWETFKQKIKVLVNSYIPFRIYKGNKRHKPWITFPIRQQIKRKRRAFKKYRTNQSDSARQKLEEISRDLKRNIQEKKLAFYDSFQDKLKNDPKEFWKFVKVNKKEDTSVPGLLQNGNLVDSDIAKAEYFNSYFKSVFSPPAPSYVRPLADRTTGMDMAEVNIVVDGIKALLRDIDMSKAYGPDELSPVIFRNCKEEIAEYLQVIFTKSLNTGLVPTDWKRANITPIFKSGSKNLVENYRPVSLTCIACKIFEHILYSSVYSFLNSRHFFSPCQHGFRRGYSCVTQLAEFTHFVSSAIDNRQSVDCVFLDFRKAFDTVPHHLLLNKLVSLGINDKIINWIADYLSDREQTVVLNGQISSPVLVTSGVPQGSVLGPLLFLIFINSICENVQSHIKLFADDCVVYRIIENGMDASVLQNDLKVIEEWCDRWEMSLNIAKCKHMCFSRCTTSLSEYKLKNVTLDHVENYKYLGVHLSSSLKWNDHVDNTVAKASKMLYFIRRNFRNTSRSVKQTLYFSFIRPLLEYACVIWDPPQSYLEQKLERVQNQALRFVTGDYSPYTSCTEMKNRLGWDLLKERRKCLRLKFFHSIYYGQTGIERNLYIFEPHYVSARRDHSRKAEEFRYNTDCFSSSFFVQTIREWNTLTEGIVSITDNDLFFDKLQTCNRD